MKNGKEEKMMKCICFVFLLCTVFFCSDCLADSWAVNTIAYGIEGSASVAVDINNSPIVVSGKYSRDLMLIRQTPNGYEVNSISQASGGRYPKLKVTTNNELALSFLISDQLWYGSKSDWFDWVFSQVEISSVKIADMALTANDIPHIVYYDYQGWIYHAFYDIHSQQWVKEQLSGFGNHTFLSTSVDIDSDGRIVISCSEGGNIRTAIYSDGFWNYLPLLTGYGAVDAAFTPDNLPSVVFGRPYQLIYAVYINDIIGWVETVVDSSALLPPPGYPISLSYDSAGIPGIAYMNTGKLMYATNVAGGWTILQIDLNGSYPDLIFDHNDKPLIVYSSYDDCIGVSVTKLAGIGLEGFNVADLNNDKIVNFRDFAVMAEYWMAQSTPPDFLAGDLNKDSFVNNGDLKWLGCNWLWQGE
jgi:hypothetical protein